MEAVQPKKIACIYFGNFQPVCKHHIQAYHHLVDKFGDDNVYLATNSQEAPLSLQEKKLLFDLHDVPTKKLTEVSDPLMVEEIVAKLSEETSVVLAMGKSGLKKNKKSFKENKSFYKVFERSHRSKLKSCKEKRYVYTIPEIKISLEDKKSFSTADTRESLAENNPDKFRKIMGFYNPKLCEYLSEKFKKFLEENKGITESINYDTIVKLLVETIVKRGNKFCLISKKTKRNLGCYRSRAGAEKRERQVQYFKKMKEQAGAGAVAGYSKPIGIEEEK
jgi:hypothetical protein